MRSTRPFEPTCKRCCGRIQPAEGSPQPMINTVPTSRRNRLIGSQPFAVWKVSVRLWPSIMPALWSRRAGAGFCGERRGRCGFERPEIGAGRIKRFAAPGERFGVLLVVLWPFLLDQAGGQEVVEDWTGQLNKSWKPHGIRAKGCLRPSRRADIGTASRAIPRAGRRRRRR